MAVPPKRTVDRSWGLYDQAVGLIPMGTQTGSKAPREALRGVEPCYLVGGEGCRVWDLDGNVYIDFKNGLGPITLGYRHPAVEEAVRRQLESGTTFSYPHPVEVDVAERLVEMVPCAERVRFLKTGGEAMAAAHRVARAFTGRDHILTCGYHGWLNTMSRPGVPEAIRGCYQDLPWGAAKSFANAFRQHPNGIAAVSVACAYGDIEKGDTFLPELRDLTTRHGALLIFDEIVTGFRLHIAGAQGYFGVAPDLAVFAKGIANGMPLSCYLGRADVMECVKDAGISSTLGGETLSLAATSATLEVYRSEDVIGTLWARGEQLHAGLNARAEALGVPVRYRGLPPLGQLTFDHPDGGALAQRFEAELLTRGIIIYTITYPSFAHTEADVGEAIDAMGEALEAMVAQELF